MPANIPAQHVRPRLSYPVLIASVWSVVLLGSLLLAACSLNRQAPDPYSRYRPAMRPEFQEHLDQLAPLPVYDINVTLNPDANELLGTAQVRVPNSSIDIWNYLIFRLYPMLEQYGGKMSISSVAVAGRPVAFTFQAQGSALRIDLVEPLPPGGQVDLSFSWSIKVPTWPDVPGVYALFGRSQEIYSLPLFYPSLAVYQNGPTVGTGRWWLDTGTVRGDAAFNYASLFVVTGTLPSDQIPVTSGVVVSSTVLDAGQTRYIWVTGPVREFLLHSSALFQQSSVTVLGTTVTSYWLPQHEAGGRSALQHTTASLRVFSEKFGPYPYTTMSVAAAPLSYRGMEYPQVSLLGVEIYDRMRSELPILTSHEVAHQWWYQLVHNDPVNLPWMDEGLAEYGVKLYYEAMRGQTAADLLQSQRWELPLRGLRIKELDTPLEQPVMAFASGSHYEIVIYGKGALFFDVVRQSLGDRHFNRLLQEYLAENRYGIVSPETFLDKLRTTAHPELESLYQQWVLQAPAASTP